MFIFCSSESTKEIIHLGNSGATVNQYSVEQNSHKGVPLGFQCIKEGSVYFGAERVKGRQRIENCLYKKINQKKI